MNKPLLALAGLIVAGGTSVGVYLAVPSGGEEEVVQQVETPTSTASPAPIASPAPTVPALPTVSPLPTLPPVPEGWVTYAQPASDKSPSFGFAYPAGWFQYGGNTNFEGQGLSVTLYSFDTVAWGYAEKYPPNSMKVLVTVAPTEGVSFCERNDGTPVTLSNFAARQSVESYDPPRDSGLTRLISIAGVSGDHCWIIVGTFAQQGPDEATFFKIVSTFTVTS